MTRAQRRRDKRKLWISRKTRAELGGYAGTPVHMQFIGGTIYCSVKGGRLNLGPDHRYGRDFTCPHCRAFVSGRLEAGHAES